MKTKEARGITIISLVVTIVVLLILAGVSISTLVGENGVVDNAKKIQNDTYYQIASEEVNQLVLEHKLTKKDETLEEFLTSKVPSRIDGVTRRDDNTLIVKKNGYEIEVESENKIIIFDATPFSPTSVLILTPANINKTTIVTTSEIIVIPLTSFVFMYFSSS